MEREPTRDDVDALVGPATPHFAYQLRARVRELVAGLPPEHDVRRYAEEKIDLLDRLGYASSKAAGNVVRLACCKPSHACVLSRPRTFGYAASLRPRPARFSPASRERSDDPAHW
jgi:hypothetical protein